MKEAFDNEVILSAEILQRNEKLQMKISED